MGTDIFEIWLIAGVFVFVIMLASAMSRIQDEETAGGMLFGCAFFFIAPCVMTVLLLTGVIAAW